MTPSIASAPELAKKHLVGEAHGAEPLGQLFAFGDAVEVGDVDHFPGLLGDRRHQVGMAMAERADRDAGAKIEIAVAVGGGQPDAVAPLEGKVHPRIGWQHLRRHWHGGATPMAKTGRNESCRLTGRHVETILFPGLWVSTRRYCDAAYRPDMAWR